MVQNSLNRMHFEEDPFRNPIPIVQIFDAFLAALLGSMIQASAIQVIILHPDPGDRDALAEWRAVDSTVSIAVASHDWVSGSAARIRQTAAWLS